ncbi:MAG: hypothetical protein JF591_04150 [Lysobacter sp.]|nr:hypothetical protein [Lysobacter sp.]
MRAEAVDLAESRNGFEAHETKSRINKLFMSMEEIASRPLKQNLKHKKLLTQTNPR